jgi:hypothetical protein
MLTDVVKDVSGGPTAAQAHHDPAAAHHYRRRHVNQEQTPRRRLSLAQGIPTTARVLITLPLRFRQRRHWYVACRFENRPVRAAGPFPEIAADDASQSRLFDRTWAQAIMAEAAGLQRQRAAAGGPEAVLRVELLRLRFEENLPIRAIAKRWGTDAARLHHAYALARQEFRAALLEVVAFHEPGSPGELEQEAANLLKALS